MVWDLVVPGVVPGVVVVREGIARPKAAVGGLLDFFALLLPLLEAAPVLLPVLVVDALALLLTLLTPLLLVLSLVLLLVLLVVVWAVLKAAKEWVMLGRKVSSACRCASICGDGERESGGCG